MTENSTVENEEWLPALDAAALISRRFGGLRNAKHALALGLRENVLSAVASSVIAFEGEDATEPVEHEAIEDQWLEVPGHLFSCSVAWDSDRLGWEWDDGLFEIHTDDSSYAFSDVHFLKSDIEAVEPSSPPYDVLQLESSRTPGPAHDRKPRARYWDWERALADLVVVAHFDGLDAFGDLTKRGNQHKLEKWFEDWFRNDSQSRAGSLHKTPSEGECRRRAQFVTAALRSRGNMQS